MSSLSLVMSVPAGPRPAGKPASVSIRISNTGPREVVCVGVLDGSEAGLRFPHYQPIILRGDTPVAVPEVPEDPLVGPLLPEHFVRLAPGAWFDPTAGFPLTTFMGYAPPEPGLYRYRLTLSTQSPSPDAWLGRLAQDATRDEVLGLIDRVPRLKLTATVVIEFGDHS